MRRATGIQLKYREILVNSSLQLYKQTKYKGSYSTVCRPMSMMPTMQVIILHAHLHVSEERYA